MNRLIAAVLLLQCFAETLQSIIRFPEDSAELTWRDILPKNCGYRNDDLANLLEEIHREKRSVNGDDDKVMNGQMSSIDAHPWQVAIIRISDMVAECGGSIVSKHHVLTAAHCFLMEINKTVNNVVTQSVEPVSPTQRLIAVGSSRYNESDLVYKIKAVFVHKFFSLYHMRNDIALLKIDGEFVWTRFVYPICLPADDESYRPGRQCGISGFGNVAFGKRNHLGIIRAATVQLSTIDDCTKGYNEFVRTVFAGMVCASGKVREDAYIDACQGDSGGPLQCKKKSGSQRVLLGITSFGFGCGVKGFPGIYTNVARYLPWIRRRLEVSLGQGDGLGSYLPEDEDVGRPANVSLDF